MPEPIDLRTAAQRQAYSPQKHYLGTLCIRAHDAGDGQSWRHLNHGNCVECTREGARAWKIANPEKSKRNTARRDVNRPRLGHSARRKKWPFALNIGTSRARAKLKNLPFDLTVDFIKTLWLEQRGECFWTGKPLDFVNGEARDPFRPSLDKIHPKSGYVQGNVVWSSNFANRARGEYPADKFATLMLELGFGGAFLVDPRVMASAQTLATDRS